MTTSGVTRRAMLQAALAGGAALATTASARSDERLKGIACRSVHLQYRGPEGLTFANEVAVERSAPGTYFCVCGFNQGYYGLQELANGKKLLIFSVWDPGRQDDPKGVPEERRVKLLHQGKGVRVGRFGNEGTGGQSFLDYDWKDGITYQFAVRAKAAGERTEYAAYFGGPVGAPWQHLVTFSTITGGKPLGGYYAFVEDFRRNRVSATLTRRARFGRGWVQGTDGTWTELTRARFTADSNPVVNIDAGVAGTDFFLATGGEITNAGTPLGQGMERPASGGKPPALPS
jgi:hypothetical protein